MVISLTELREIHQKQEEAQNQKRFPWQEEPAPQKEGILKFVRFLYSD